MSQISAFKFIHDLTAYNGLMIHGLPAQGYINHGPVNYNPSSSGNWRAARYHARAYGWLTLERRERIERGARRLGAQ